MTVFGLVVRKSPERLKLEAQEKEHARLLREIEKSKLRCEATEQVSREAHDELYRETTGLRARLSSALEELHQIFASLLSPKSRLGRSDRAALRRFYQQVLGGLPPDVGEAAPESRDASDSPPPPFEGEWAGAHQPGEHASAHKPSEGNTSLLRALYKKLAVALHPDRARDPNESARLTAVMKEVTRAYAEEDLAKLVEIDRSWLVQNPEGDAALDLERRAAALIEANRELRRQLRALTARLRELEEVLPGVSRRGKRPPNAAEIAATTLQALEQELADLERMRDAARDLFQGRSSVFEFLTGPRSPADAPDPLGDRFEQMFEELLEDMAERARADTRRKPRRR
ncbi:MAG: J domain-containing protein [Deltaproteobacteria bacterium]